MRELLRRILAGLVWLALVAAIALGAAGLVSGTDHPPGSPARAELTYARDREVETVLVTASGQLVELADQVAALGVQARGALAALNGTETSTVEAAIAEGDRLLDEMLAQTTTLRRELAGVPYLARADTALLLSAGIVAWHAALVAALDATEGLQAAWVRLTNGSVAAIQLSTLLAQHDRQVTEAAGLGRAAGYEDAMARLDQADATITDARALRDRLANTVDVTILDQWLDRNAAYDVALRGLYAAYSNVGSKVTDELRDAIAAEAAARRNLPPDTRGLVVIMAEISRGGMNGAVIAIEEARGRLTSAIDRASQAPSPSATP
ncbi:MAG: hypothetical protein Q7S35_14075 [Candidatus Limnocylindrales bacterium]|nr:hypothetical protein [Candidatus Limnocylindrales bacterium]